MSDTIDYMEFIPKDDLAEQLSQLLVKLREGEDIEAKLEKLAKRAAVPFKSNAPDATRDKLMALIAETQGMTYKELAAKAGLSLSYTKMVVSDCGFPVEKRELDDRKPVYGNKPKGLYLSGESKPEEDKAEVKTKKKPYAYDPHIGKNISKKQYVKAMKEIRRQYENDEIDADQAKAIKRRYKVL